MSECVDVLTRDCGGGVEVPESDGSRSYERLRDAYGCGWRDTARGTRESAWEDMAAHYRWHDDKSHERRLRFTHADNGAPLSSACDPSNPSAERALALAELDERAGGCEPLSLIDG